MAPDSLIRSLRARCADRETGVTDVELLARYAASKDEAAFELLIRRHAEMVWRVCRGIIRDHHSAEDAFQAVFLALARSAEKGVRESVAGWLYRAAYHAALKAKSLRRDEPVGASVPDRAAELDPFATERAELARALHEELNRLGDRYRLPLVLCELEGHTQAEAARVLGWPLGTVATRVNRGRDLLRQRLTRRGVALSAAGVAAALTAPPASARPPLLTTDACQAINSGSVAPPVRHLADGILSAMVQAKKGLALAATLVLLVGAAVAVAAWPGADPKTDSPAAPIVGEKERPLKALIVVYDRDAVARTIPVRDATELAALEECFPNYRKRPSDGAAVTWKPGFEVYFDFANGNTVRVMISQPEGRPVLWSLGRGQFPLTGGFSRFLAGSGAAPGEVAGAWSPPVNNLKARLLVAKTAPVNGTPLVTARVEVQLVQAPAAPITVPWNKVSLRWTVNDVSGKQIHRASAAGNWLADAPAELVLNDTRPQRLPASGAGTGVAANKKFALDLAPEGAWTFEPRDTTEYSLSARLFVEAGSRGWSGTLDIPSVRIPGSGK